MGSIRENPNEMQGSNTENDKLHSNSSNDDEKSHDKHLIFNLARNLDNKSEFFNKSFKVVIEKPESDEIPEKFETKSSHRLRRTTSKFGTTELYSKSKPKITRNHEPVIFFRY